MSSIASSLITILFDGSERLSAKSREVVASYISSKELTYGGFMDRAGNPDVYYTFFGLMCALALDMDINKYHKNFLNSIDVEKLDMPNLMAYVQSRNLLKLFTISIGFRKIAAKNAFNLGSFEGFPSSVKRSLNDAVPYSVFLAMMIPKMVPDKATLGKWLDTSALSYRTSDGGWTNVIGNNKASLNATVSALMIQRYYYASFKPIDNNEIDIVDNRALLWLKNQQVPIGGFVAAPGAPVPDLLSTATALTALKIFNTRPCYVATDFIQNHWRNDGGFASTFMEEETDCEYTFYGLLALGATQKPAIMKNRS